MTSSSPVEPTAASGARDRRTIDLVVSIVVGAIALICSPALLMLGGISIMGDCLGPDCVRADPIPWLVLIVVIPPVLFIIGAVITVVQLVRRRLAWPWIVGGVVLGLISVTVGVVLWLIPKG